MINKVVEYIEQNQESSVNRLFELLSIPSISTDPQRKADLVRTAEWVHRLFVDCGIKAQIVQTPGHPCVLADSGPAEGDGPTILVYGHYDVQPEGDAGLWKSPAFSPTIHDGAIYARGAADDKGQVLTHLLAAESWMKVAGKLPIRVKFIVEGEEEIGSPNLEALVRDHKDQLTCDYVVISDTPKFDLDTPAITYGTKGLVYKELTVKGPSQNLHSGSYGGTLTNPGNALALIIASLRDGDNRVTIPGFYDDVREISDVERSRMTDLPFDEDAYREAIGAPSLDGEKGYTTLERRWARPTLDVNGLLGGFTGEGSSTVIPAKAMAKVSMRLVPDQEPAKISAAFDEAVKRAAPPGVRVEVRTHASCAAYVSDLDSKGMAAAARAIEAAFGRAPVFIREGGSLPILPLLKKVLDADSLMLGFCVPESNIHGPNELIHVSDFHSGTKAAAYFVHEMAKT